MTAKQKYASVAVDDLTLDPANINQHDDAGIGAIAESLRTFGQQKPIVATREHVVAAGNGTVMAAIELGMQTLDVRYTDLTVKQLRAYKIADNQTGRLSAFDDDMLEKELHEIEATLLPALGFPDDELNAILAGDDGPVDDGPEPDIDHAAELQKKWGTARGQVWRIGDHRLMCGDATDGVNVDILMNDEKFSVVISDPPYGINYKSGKDGELPRSVQGDKDTAARDGAIFDFVHVDFPVACFATWRCVPPREPRGQLVWHKNTNGMGDLGFPWWCDYEMIWIFGYGWKGPRGTSVLKGETICTWNTGPARRHHPHQKSAEVVAEVMGKAPDGIVYEPFIGSGTMFVAAEQLNRKCYGMEIDPAFTAVALQRMDDMGVTGELIK